MDQYFSEWLLNAFQNLLFSLPMYTAYFTAMIIALVLWKRHPRISLYVLLSNLFSLFLDVISIFIRTWITNQLFLKDSVVTHDNFLTISKIITLTMQTFYLVPFTLLLMAAFSNRKPLQK